MKKKRNPEKPPADVQPLLHSVRTTRKLLGDISHSKIYDLFASGQLKWVKMGRRRFVTADEAVRYVRSLEVAA